MPQRPTTFQKIQKELKNHNLATILNKAFINRKYVYVFKDAVIRLLLNPGVSQYKYIYILEIPRGSYSIYNNYVYDPILPKRYRWVYSDKTQIEIKEVRSWKDKGTMELLEELDGKISDQTMTTILFHLNEI